MPLLLSTLLTASAATGPQPPPSAPTAAAPAPRFVPPTDRRYRIGRRLHIAGNLAAGGGLVAVPLGLLGWVHGARNNNAFTGLGGVLLATVGGVGVVSGPVLGNVGALIARNGAGGVASPALGIAGLVALGGGVALGNALYDAGLEDAGIAAIAGGWVASVGLGVAQLQVVRSAHRRQLALVPTPGGLAVAGRW